MTINSERIRGLMNSQRFYILDGDQVRNIDFYAWIQIRDLEGNTNTIAKSYIDDILISTVFLGIEHGFDENHLPLLFETMVFAPGREFDELCARYSNKQEAVEFHQTIYDKIQSLWVEESFNMFIYLAIPFVILLGILAA